MATKRDHNKYVNHNHTKVDPSSLNGKVIKSVDTSAANLWYIECAGGSVFCIEATHVTSGIYGPELHSVTPKTEERTEDAVYVTFRGTRS